MTTVLCIEEGCGELACIEIISGGMLCEEHAAQLAAVCANCDEHELVDEMYFTEEGSGPFCWECQERAQIKERWQQHDEEEPAYDDEV